MQGRQLNSIQQNVECYMALYEIIQYLLGMITAVLEQYLRRILQILNVDRAFFANRCCLWTQQILSKNVFYKWTILRYDINIKKYLEEKRVLTPDLGGSAKTNEVGDEVARKLEEKYV